MLRLHPVLPPAPPLRRASSRRPHRYCCNPNNTVRNKFARMSAHKPHTVRAHDSENNRCSTARNNTAHRGGAVPDSGGKDYILHKGTVSGSGDDRAIMTMLVGDYTETRSTASTEIDRRDTMNHSLYFFFFHVERGAPPRAKRRFKNSDSQHIRRRIT